MLALTRVELFAIFLNICSRFIVIIYITHNFLFTGEINLGLSRSELLYLYCYTSLFISRTNSNNV